MALKSVTASAQREYSSPRDPAIGTEGATVFVLGLLDVFLTANIYDRALTYTRADDDSLASTQVRLNAQNIEVVRYGLRGWRHFQGAKGNDVPFVTVDRVINGRTYKAVGDDALAALAA